MNPMPDIDRVLTALFDSPATAEQVTARSGLRLETVQRVWLPLLGRPPAMASPDEHGVWSLTSRGRMVAAGVEMFQRRVVMG